MQGLSLRHKPAVSSRLERRAVGNELCHIPGGVQTTCCALCDQELSVEKLSAIISLISPKIKIPDVGIPCGGLSKIPKWSEIYGVSHLKCVRL